VRTTSEPRREALGLLGLARRAGGVAAGTDAVRQSVRGGRARLIVTAEDASDTQLRKIRSTIHDRAIPQVILGDRATLGAAVGSAPLAAVAVTNGGLAERILEAVGRASVPGDTDEAEARQ